MSFTGKLGTSLSKPGQIKLANPGSNTFNNAITLASTTGFSINNVIQFKPDTIILSSLTSFTLGEDKIFTSQLGTQWSKPIRFKLATVAPIISPSFDVTLTLASTTGFVLDKTYIANDGAILASTVAQANAIEADCFPTLTFAVVGFVNRDVSQGYNPIVAITSTTEIAEAVRADEAPSLTVAGIAAIAESPAGSTFGVPLTLTSSTGFVFDSIQVLFVNLTLQSHPDELNQTSQIIVTLASATGFSASATIAIPTSLSLNSVTGLAESTTWVSNISFSINSITNFNGIDGPSEVVFLQGHPTLSVNVLVTQQVSFELVTDANFLIQPQLNAQANAILQGFPRIGEVVFAYAIGGITLIAGSSTIGMVGFTIYGPFITLTSHPSTAVDCLVTFNANVTASSNTGFVGGSNNPFGLTATIAGFTSIGVSGFVAHFNNLMLTSHPDSIITTGNFTFDATISLNVKQNIIPTLTSVYQITFQPLPDSDPNTQLFFLNLGNFKLRPPIFGNEDKVEISRINRTTRNGTRRVFRQPYWPKIQTFHWEIEGLRETDAKKAMQIFEASLGQDIIITDFEGRKMQGLVLTPLSNIIQHGPNDDFHIMLDFEGTYIP